MAASTIAIAPVLLIYLLAQRYLVEGLTSGGVK
jgi:ABC-type glycerol-3-phosphate transport system permease component